MKMFGTRPVAVIGLAPILAALLGIQFALAQDEQPPAALNPEEKQWIAANPTFRVAASRAAADYVRPGLFRAAGHAGPCADTGQSHRLNITGGTKETIDPLDLLKRA